ncbi:unnamed protein product [Phytomonas sp. EM1]|nr:unnamed protein product [Phytomonas sp. EM1]|eukprot:CCW63772.1 unnamed protein product [Phytomonas sp. isolate EM1]
MFTFTPKISMNENFHRFNYLMDKNTVIFVSVCVVGVNLYYFDPTATTVVVPSMTVMCCFMVAVNMILKRILNHSRPSGALKESAGMPSNHAASLMFLSIIACEGLQRSHAEFLAPCSYLTFTCVTPSYFFLWLIQGLIIAFAIYGSVLRVICGDHTMPQVLVGGAFGLSSAILVMRLNYAGYTGLRAGGRIDELGYPVKRLLLFVSTGIISLTVKKIAHSYKRYILSSKCIMKERRKVNSS